MAQQAKPGIDVASLASFALSKITVLFSGGSSPAKFAQWAQKFEDTTLPELQQISDPSEQLTQISKHLVYGQLFYADYRRKSRSKRSKQGNQLGLNYFNEKLATFNKYLNELKQSGQVKLTSVKHKFDLEFIPGMKMDTGRGAPQNTGTYYKVSWNEAKSSSSSPTLSVKNETPYQVLVQQGSMMNTFIVIAIIGLIIAGINKFKK